MQNSGPEQLNSLHRGTNLFLIHPKWPIYTVGGCAIEGGKMSPQRLRAGDPTACTCARAAAGRCDFPLFAATHDQVPSQAAPMT